MTIKWSLNGAPPSNRYVYENKQPPYNKVCIGMRGQYGDVIMQEPALRKFIKENPDTKIVLAVAKKYEQVLPLFKDYHENIIEFKSFEGYDNWPTEEDTEYLQEQEFDALFPPDIPLHPDPLWAKQRHIVSETALMIGLTADTTDIELKMPQEVKKEPNTIAVHMFSSKWPGGTRSISVEKQTKIVAYLKELGYKVYQISSPNQPHIEGTIFEHGTYYDACIKMLSTDMLISCDSGMAWVASAYNHPTIALFSTAYNSQIGTTKNWHPVNPNGVYMEELLADQVPFEKIKEQINLRLGINK